jgi:hypothetical protein
MLKPKPASGLSKFIAVLVSSSIGISLIVFIYFMLKEREADKYRRILQNPYPMEAIVTEKRNYKGKGIDVEYTVNDQIYEYKTLIDNHTYQQYQVGDTISVTICQDDPSLALLTMEINKEKLKRFLGEDAGRYWEEYKKNK